jgi:ATP/maltotriose-dependent transcriptional regulator MalT/DNA-binding SARP family transcriptional activator
MQASASLAKISRPRLFGVICRERLFELLDANQGRPMLWVSGPPGAGKTTLIASYLEQRGAVNLWYQIDPDDSDPAAFFHYLVLAAQSLQKRQLAAIPKFLPEHWSNIAAFARLFFRALFSSLPAGMILVLDNFQQLDPSSAVHAAVHEAVREVPRNSSIVLISRELPPLSFVEFSASGALYSVGWDQIQFTLDEVRALSAHHNVTEAWLLNAVHRESQGWAAGITLMLERLASFRGKEQMLSSETRESVFNYFANLIFDQAPETTRHILRSVAFLPRVTAPLAESLSGTSNAGAVLEDLYRRRMFTDRRPGADHVYQLHALFIDFLRARARQTLSADALAALLEGTALALEKAGEIDDAIEVWRTASNWAHMVRLIHARASTLLKQGRRQTLTQQILSVPEGVRSRDPWLLYWLGRAQVQIDPQLGIQTLRLALKMCEQQGNRAGRLECLTTLLGGAFLGFHGLDQMDPWLDQLLHELEGVSDDLSVDAELRLTSVLCLALFHVRPWHASTASSYQRIEELLPQCSDASIALEAAMAALVVSGLCGDFERGDRLVRAIEPLVSDDAASPSQAAWTLGQVVWLRFIEARYEAGLACVAQALAIAEANGLHQVARQLLLWRYTTQWRIGDWPAALASMAEVEAIDLPVAPMAQAQFGLFKARAAGHRGQKDEASRLALASHQSTMQIGSRLEEVVFELSNADVQLDAGQVAHARPMLKHTRTLITRAPLYECFLPALLLLEARCARDEGDEPGSLERLRECMTVARRHNHRYYLRLCDWSMPSLFQFALDHRIETGLVIDLIRIFRVRPPPESNESWPYPTRILTLGRFEIRVNDEPVEFARKLPRKTLLLLKTIVSHGNREVSEQALCDLLWADEEGDAAHNALSITVLRLRKLLGSNDAIMQKGGKIRLNPAWCWVDAWAFDARVGTSGQSAIEALRLYHGAFLPEDEQQPWSVSMRERLRGKFIHALSRQGEELEARGDTQAAAECYLRGTEADPVVESCYQGLMRCYDRLGKRGEAFSVYRRLKQTLSVVLGVPPCESTQRLFEALLRSQAEEADAVGEMGRAKAGAVGRRVGTQSRREASR